MKKKSEYQGIANAYRRECSARAIAQLNAAKPFSRKETVDMIKKLNMVIDEDASLVKPSYKK